MANFFNTAKNILKDHDYLGYKEIVDIATKRGWFHTDWKTPELTMSSRLWMDIRQKWVKSTFIRIWDGIFALRKPPREDNLLTYLRYRLRNFPVWEIDDKDKKYLLDIFWRDIFEDEKIELFSLIKKLKDSWKVNDYTIVDDKILVVLKKEKKGYEDSSKEQIALLKSASEIGEWIISKEDLEKENEELKNKLGITVKWMRNEVGHNIKNIATRKIKKNILNETIKKIQKDTERIKELSENINKNSGLQELTQSFQKVWEDLKNILPQVFANWLLWVNNKTLGQFEQLSTALEWMHKNPVFENFWKIISWVQENLKLYDISQLTKAQLAEFNALNNQVWFLSQIMVNPEDFFNNLPPKESVWFILPTALPAKLWTNKQDFTHTFEGYLQEWDFKTIRWFASIQDLAKISKAIYQSEWWVQRKEDKNRCEKIKQYIEYSSKRFFPEVTLWFYIRDNWAITEPSKLKDGHILIGKVGISVDLSRIEDWQITRIDGNHRLYFWKEIKADFSIPFCFVIFDQKWENKDLIKTHKHQEANIFYLLNGKNVPVSSEEALQVLLNMPDDEAQSLYQNDSTLWLTRLCKQKYESYFNTNSEDTKRNFWDRIYTKFELLVKYIEKIWIENDKIVWLIDKIFSSINHLDKEYNKIISRDDYFYLVLNVVLDNESKTSPKINEIIKDFFNWILKEWLEDISFSEKPILWELFKKQKNLKETINIHSYQINPVHKSKLSNFIKLLEKSKELITNKVISDKQAWLEKIVDAFINLSTVIAWNEIYKDCKYLTDRAGVLMTSMSGTAWKILFSAINNMDKINQVKSICYIENHFNLNLWSKIANEDFYIRHSENLSTWTLTSREMINDEQFIEFLYCEYDNAIKFILDKAGFLVR